MQIHVATAERNSRKFSELEKTCCTQRKKICNNTQYLVIRNLYRIKGKQSMQRAQHNINSHSLTQHV